MTAPPRPIFAIGSLRSGASMLTWSLGQHPNIRPMMDNSWLEPFAASLEATFAVAVRKRAVSQLDIMGVELEDFYARFGDTINQLLLSGSPVGSVAGRGTEPSRSGNQANPNGAHRWIDGSPRNGFNVVGLRRLFPEAKFIHILRDASAVVETLTNQEKRPTYRSHWRKFTEEGAYGHWLEAVEACVAAERAYGSDVVLRIRRDDLINDAEPTVRRCLEFVGEPFAPACLWPFEAKR